MNPLKDPLFPQAPAKQQPPAFPSTNYLLKQKLPMLQTFLLLAIICSTSLQVIWTNMTQLEHGRQFIRSLHYNLLGHDSLDFYWTGQAMLNYPINEFELMTDFDEFLGHLIDYFGGLGQYAYGIVDQNALNHTKQHLYLYAYDGYGRSYEWDLANGFTYPFQVGNIPAQKYALLSTRSMRIEFETIDLSGHKWNIFIVVEPFSHCSLIARVYAHYLIDLSKGHILSCCLGITLLIATIVQSRKQRTLGDIPNYFLCFFLLYSTAMSLSEHFSFEWVFIIDGVTCLSAWLCVVRLYGQYYDYNMSVLLRRSWLMIGRLFLSFFPLFMAFSLVGYCFFCRYSGQFSSLYKTIMTIFYICYYNMTYYSVIVTSRSTFAMPFFIMLVLIFTMCIYSGMLVSVFCSYVWSKRYAKIKKDIEESLKIYCCVCGHKYQYKDRKIVERGEEKPLHRRICIAEELKIDFYNDYQCSAYKQFIVLRIGSLRKMVENCIDGNIITYSNIKQPSKLLLQIYRYQCYTTLKTVRQLIGDS